MKMRQIKDITDQLPKAAGKTYSTRALSQIVRYVVHHSASSTGDPWTYAKYHVNTHGWPGIGYHFVIQKDGTIYQTNRLETVSFGVKDNNTGSVNICLTGQYETETPPADQINALVWLLKTLAEKVGAKPIVPHNSLTATKCPGEKVNMKEITKQVYG
jgi:N-acetyl-anhydromuramyl-L-alanine amidase AmpD